MSFKSRHGMANKRLQNDTALLYDSINEIQQNNAAQQNIPKSKFDQI